MISSRLLNNSYAQFERQNNVTARKASPVCLSAADLDVVRNTQLMMVLSLFLLFGLTWSVAFFSYGPMRIPSYYIFTVLISFQGNPIKYDVTCNVQVSSHSTNNDKCKGNENPYPGCLKIPPADLKNTCKTASYNETICSENEGNKYIMRLNRNQWMCVICENRPIFNFTTTGSTNNLNAG
ncbi:hypothetical protein QQF64_010615, partial [Cirrhinus molitorella]